MFTNVKVNHQNKKLQEPGNPNTSTRNQPLRRQNLCYLVHDLKEKLVLLYVESVLRICWPNGIENGGAKVQPLKYRVVRANQFY